MGNFLHRKRKLNCAQVEAQLIAYIKGGLSPRDMQSIRDHIATCEVCERALRDAEALETQLVAEAQHYRPTLSFEASARVQERIYQRMRRGLIMQRTSRLALRTVGLIVIIILAIGTLILLQGPQQPLTPAADPTRSIGEFDTSDAKVVITFADYEIREKSWEPIIDEFNNMHPNIEVQFVPLDVNLRNVEDESAFAIRMKELASKADTFLLPFGIRPEVTTYVLDLAAWAETDPEVGAGDFWRGTLDGCSTDQRTIGLPFEVGFQYIFFDSAAFDAAGLPQPDAGWTLESFQQAARALTQRENEQITRYGFIDPSMMIVAPYIDDALARTGGAIDAKALSAALDWFTALVREGVLAVPSVNGEESDTLSTLIDNGKAAMWTDHWGNLSWRRSTLGPTIQALPFPIMETVSDTTPGFVTCTSISAGTQHANEAWVWLKFLSKRQLGDSWGSLPARVSIAENAVFWQAAPTGATARFALEHAYYQPQYHQSVTALTKAFTQALADGTDPQSAFAQIDAAAIAPIPTPSADNIVVATPQPSIADVQVVDYYSFSFVHPSNATINTLANEFNRTHTGIQVKASSNLNVSEGETFNLSDVAQQFDCFPWFTNREIINTQSLYSLDALIDADPQGAQLLADYATQTLESMRINGQLYALPAQLQPPIIYYNADHFATLELQPPALDWTFEEFLALAAAATSDEGDDKVYGFVPFQGNYIEFLLAAYNIQPYDLTTNPPTLRLDAPETVAAFAQLTNMFEAGMMPAFEPDGTRALQGNYSERERIVVSGHAAMWTDLAGLRGGFSVDQDAPFKFGYAPLPRVRGSIVPPPPQGFFISRRTSDPSGCWEWIKFLSEQPSAFSAVPARHSVSESADWEAAVGLDTAAAYRAALLYSEPFVQLSEDASISSVPIDRWLADVVGAVFEGADPATELPRVQHYAEDYVACMAQSNARDEEQVAVCAKAADPGYKTLQELAAGQ